MGPENIFIIQKKQYKNAIYTFYGSLFKNILVINLEECVDYSVSFRFPSLEHGNCTQTFNNNIKKCRPPEIRKPFW